jgi:hypothetical protein
VEVPRLDPGNGVLPGLLGAQLLCTRMPYWLLGERQHEGH